MFGQKKPSRNRKRSTSAHSFEKLEDRNLLASFSLNDAGQLYVAGTTGADDASLSIADNAYVATVDNASERFPIANVNEIYFLGYGGDDTFTNNTSSTVTVYGHAGNDTLIGGDGDDVLIGGSGNDTIHGNDGNDRLVGANGDDVIFGGKGNDKIFGSSGTNELHGEDGNDIMYGSDNGDDIMNGNDGLDWIFGLGGDDILDAGNGGSADEGAELIMGHGGNDTFFGGDGMNMFWGGNGDDIMNGGKNADNRMHGQAGNDTLIGGDKADLMRGHAGDDTLTGNGGSDTIEAGSDSGDVVTFTEDFAKAKLEIAANGQDATISANGTDRVLGAEWLEFSDRRVSSNLANLAAPEAASQIEMNDYRSSKSLVELSAPSDLTKFAEAWSKEMAKVGLSHSSEDSRKALLVGGRRTVGENVIQVFDTGQTAAEIAAEMHDAWVNSPVHHANILHSDFSEIGIGIYKSGGFWWGTHVFAG